MHINLEMVRYKGNLVSSTYNVLHHIAYVVLHVTSATAFLIWEAMLPVARGTTVIVIVNSFIVEVGEKERTHAKPQRPPEHYGKICPFLGGQLVATLCCLIDNMRTNTFLVVHDVLLLCR